MLWIFWIMALQLLTFAPADFLWRVRSPFKLHQILIKTALHQKYRTGKPHPARHILHLSLLPRSDLHIFWGPMHISTLYVFTICGCFFKCHLFAFSISYWFLTGLLSFPRQIFHFSKVCFLSTNKTFIFVCLITPALLSSLYFFVFGSEVCEPSVPLKQFA